MSLTRLLKLLLPVAMVVATLLLVTNLVDVEPDAGVPSGPPAAPGSAAATSSPPPPMAEASMYRGHQFAVDADPTEDKGQSKLWFHDGRWWGILVGAGTTEYRIHRLDWDRQAWVDTGVLVDERPTSHADALAVDDHVYVISASPGRGASDHLRILRFTFDAELDTYHMDPDFPVRLTDVGGRSATIARDSLGRLWVSYIQRGRIWLARTDGGDHVWLPPFTPPVAGSAGVADHVVLIAYAGSVVVVWSNQAEDAIYHAQHPDDAPDDEWIGRNVIVDGLDEADDHLDVRVIDEDTAPRLFVAVKTSLDEAEQANPAWEQVLLLVLDPDGTWSRHLFGTLRDRHTRPVLAIDAEARQLYMIAASRSGGSSAIYYKRTSVDDITFEPGVGTPLIVSPRDDRMTSPTSTKQHVSSETGLVVMATDRSTGQYLHGVVPLGEAPPAASNVDAATPGSGQGGAAADPAPGWIIHDTFDPWPVQAAVPNGWQDALGGTLVEDDSGGTVALLQTADAEPVRACKPIPDVTRSALRVNLRVRLDAVGDADAVLVQVRRDGVEAAGVRINSRGRLAYAAAGEKIITEVPFQFGAWYEVRLQVDEAASTYAWEVLTGAGVPVAGASEVPMPPSAEASDRICVQTSGGAAGLALRFDDVRIGRD